MTVPLTNAELNAVYLSVIDGREIDRAIIERLVDDLQEARQIARDTDDFHLGDALGSHWRGI